MTEISDRATSAVRPFAESKEQIAGFYIINAEDLDDVRDWARQVAEATNHSIEVRLFAATGLVKDIAR